MIEKYFSQKTVSWIAAILHIETLFILTCILILIYYFFFADRKKFNLENLYKVTNHKYWDKEKKEKHRKINKHEERCREIFESIFSTPFKSTRPKWLKNPATGQNLELDGFSPNISTSTGKGLAFEYDGVQHSKYTKHFHKNGPKEFIYQTKKDTWKDLRCKEEGVMLIRIPHFVAFQDLERYIKQKLRTCGFKNHVDNEIFSGS